VQSFLADGARVSFQTFDATYLAVYFNSVRNTSTVAGPDETFTLLRAASDSWFVQARSGTFFTADANAVVRRHAAATSHPPSSPFQRTGPTRCGCSFSTAARSGRRGERA
jgi:hypothetical protein